ncbi:peptidase S8, subtilisin-related [Kipferlia bialata]|uniref:Peptidase S8, subtilisin-related n=1 Tax=Kipferlia bialata TaxID=797122 RepID=A0A9K3CWQ5_9EUKA|nr:peptidase S8, subtilisin-related [Kipferlia bialata]|eukprot:g5212.t1
MYGNQGGFQQQQFQQPQQQFQQPQQFQGMQSGLPQAPAGWPGLVPICDLNPYKNKKWTICAQVKTKGEVREFTSKKSGQPGRVLSLTLVDLAGTEIQCTGFTDFVDIHASQIEQWWADNDGSIAGCVAGVDINVGPVWDKGYTGEGVTVCVNDDGIDYKGESEFSNVSLALSYNYQDDVNDPTPVLLTDTHGTACAGIIAATHDNGYCIAGVAPGVELAGRVIISADLAVSDWTDAYTRGADEIDVYSNSYGYYTCSEGQCYQLLDVAPMEAAYQTATEAGAMIVFAAGNEGANAGADVNMDPSMRSPDTIIVAAAGCTGTPSYYSRGGSSVFTMAPGGDFTSDAQDNLVLISTVGRDSCTDDFSGTSAACPMVSGVLALAKEAQPGLTTRGAMHALAATGINSDSNSAAYASRSEFWQRNSAGFDHNFYSGFGLMDAQAVLEYVDVCQCADLPDYDEYVMIVEVDQDLPDDSSDGLTVSFNVPGDVFLRVEHIKVEISGNVAYFGDVSVECYSPSGTRSGLMPPRLLDNAQGYISLGDLSLYSVRSWHEQARGTWRVVVADRYAGDTNSLDEVRLTLRGVVQESRVTSPTAYDTWVGGTVATLALETGCTQTPGTAGCTDSCRLSSHTQCMDVYHRDVNGKAYTLLEAGVDMSCGTYSYPVPAIEPDNPREEQLYLAPCGEAPCLGHPSPYHYASPVYIHAYEEGEVPEEPTGGFHASPLSMFVIVLVNVVALGAAILL